MDALKAEDLSTTQATYFESQWAVVHHLPNTITGFSATLFRRLENDPVSGAQAGELVLALRGTEQLDLDLLQADFRELVGNGLAINQIVDMYNYWQKLITPVGTDARQAVLVPATASTPSDQQVVIKDPVSDELTTWTIDYFYTSDSLGKVSASDTLASVTGHSLGGHLASAFTRLFPEETANAVTFNGAGYPTGSTPGLPGTALANIPNLFGMLGGESTFNADIVNLYGDKNPEIVTMHNMDGLVQPGEHQPLFIEQETIIADKFGHGMGQMSDSAAVYDLLIRLDAGWRDTNIGNVATQLIPMFESASNSRTTTLEEVVNALGGLFGAGTEIAEAQSDDREALYARIIAIRDSAAYQAAVTAGSIYIVSFDSAQRDRWFSLLNRITIKASPIAMH